MGVSWRRRNIKLVVEADKAKEAALDNLQPLEPAQSAPNKVMRRILGEPDTT